MCADLFSVGMGLGLEAGNCGGRVQGQTGAEIEKFGSENAY